MAAGDISLTNVVLTVTDLDILMPLLVDKLNSTAKDPSQYQEVSSLEGLSSLPAFLLNGSTYSLVRVALSVLKGVDGKQVELQENTEKTYIQWRYTDSATWTNLIAIADLKGNAGEKVVFRTGSTGIEWKYESDANTSYQVLVAYDILKLNYTDLTELQKEELKGDTGKTPVLEDVIAVSSSTTPSGTITPDGVDETGNPKYKFSFVLPKGDKGDVGIGISNIAKTSTEGLVDTYTITYTDASTSTFTVSNGAAGSIGSGDAKDLTATFTEAATRANISSGETIAILFGKIKKWFTDLASIISDAISSHDSATDAHASLFANKQNVLTAGNGIDITNNVISSTIDLTLYQLVTSLPTSDISTNKIYLMQSGTSGTNNIYTEYIYVNSSWEILGEYTSAIDLTPYYTKTQIDGLISSMPELNVDVISPLSSGYYTLATAINAVPTYYRRINSKITFTSAAGIQETYQFKSSVDNWGTSSNWEFLYITGKYGNMGITDNVNALALTGFYTSYGAATGVPGTDYSWFVIHQNSSAGNVYAYQRAIAYSTTLIVYERVKINSVWQAWVQTNAIATTSANGLMSATDKMRMEFNYGSNSVTTLANLPVTKNLVVATLSAATTLSVASGLEINQSIHVCASATAAFTQTIPNNANYGAMNGTSFNIAEGTHFEIDIKHVTSGVYWIMVSVQS